MASTSQETPENPPGPSILKRKRSSEKKPSGDENSDSEEEEYELITKMFAKSCGKSETISNNAVETNQPKLGAPTSRKRKYVFKTEDIAPKKCRNFYYINDLMTKPRKPKVKFTKEQEATQEIVPKKHKLHFAKIDGSGHICLMHRSYMKSDLFFNDEKKCSYESSKKLDLGFHIVDEIALEGLDGITIEAFWKRLKNVFPNNISKAMADRMWRLICNNKRINFFILKEPREQLIFIDRCKYLDVDSGMFLEPFIEFKDIYPMSSVNGTDIRGSCATFHTRKENNGVRKFSLDKAIKLYDQRLVFVADQTLRNKTLINEEADPNIELLDVEYCMLEKIGRSRDQGEFTQGKMSLINDSKKNYHNRKILTQHFLIAQQSFCLKSFALQQNMSGGLIHLARFYHRRKSKQIIIMERLANVLRSKSNYMMEFTEFRKIFGRNMGMVKMMKTAEFRKFFKIITFPYRKLYPNAKKQEYLHKNKHKERQIRVIKMIDPCANITAIIDAKDMKEPLHEKIDESVGRKLMNYEYLRDIFLFVLSCGQGGATIQEIQDYFKTDFYSVRMAMRKLLLKNVVGNSKIDLGRQQSLKFFAKCWSLSGCVINTQPKPNQLTEKTLSRVLKGYDAKLNDPSVEFYSESDPPTEVVPLQTQFDLSFEPFCCTAFLTETVDDISEELTIYDIVIKGRDKLLLIESNLFAHYISEWDDFLLKREDFSKTVQLFQNGFGKVIYDFLTTIRINEALEVDNRIIFSLDKITAETKISRQCLAHRFNNIFDNFSHPYSDNCYIDTISKIYLFEAMFNESHKSDRCIKKLKTVFERVMVFDGKRKRETESVKAEPKIELEVANNVVMERFMGSDSCLEWSGEEEDIKIEIFVSTKSAKVKKSGTMFTTDELAQTQRYIKRANIILKSVYENKVVKDVTTLYKDILKEEGEEGYDKRACKKSIVSILSKLVTDGYVKCYQIVMSGNNTTRTQCFICVHEVDAQHNLIRSTIDQLKLKFYVGSSMIQKTIKVKKKMESPFSSSDVRESITELKQLTTAKAVTNVKFDKCRGKVYGYAPKFVRMRVLHEHLFYVIRELTECDQLSSREVFDLCKNLKIKMSQNEIIAMPPVYRNEVSWRMFIPSLPKHKNYPKGWALACDIVLRMPLSVFVKLYNLTYEIEELETYLKHPIKRHYLVKHLPVNIRNILLQKRKYFHSIYEMISHLCYIGLLQMGPRNFKEKDQLFIFLNLRASLYDTSTSSPGYNQIEDKKYKKIPFEFKSVNDVEIYWSEMLRICLNTQLGKRKILDGQYVTIEDCASKPAMIETLKAKSFDGALADDTGRIPGDRKGSAGFDSSLWSYVKRNWMWNSQLDSKAKSNIQSHVTGLKKEKYDLTLPTPIQYDLLAKGGPPERKIYLKPVKPVKTSQIKSIIVKRTSKKKFMRKIIAPRTKRIREYYDDIDKSIMKKNPTFRVEWDEEEDQLLRYCRSASVFLCPISKKQTIPYNIIRDVLHRIHPKSKNKTARAIQRRIYGALTNDETIKIMETNIENLNSDTIAKYFDQIRNRYKYNIKITDSQMYISFVYLMSYIFKHRKEIELLLLGFSPTSDFFSDANIGDYAPIVQNCENENSTIYSNPKTLEDVTKDTIKSVVHCSMASRKNTIGWTFLLSRIYKKFDDELIRTTVANLKKDQFFVLNKKYDGKNLDRNWPTPIKFSSLYNMMKSSTYTIDMYRETYSNFISIIEERTDPEIFSFMVCNELNSFWDRVVLEFEIPELGIILNPEIEDHSEVIEELARRFRCYLDKIYEKKSETKKSDVTQSDVQSSKNVEKDIEEIKSEVRHLIFRVPYLLEGNLETCFRKMLDCKNNLEIYKYIFSMICDLKQFAEENIVLEDLKQFIFDLEDETSMHDQQKLLKNLSKVVFVIQNILQQQQHDTKSFEDAFKLWEIEIWIDVGTKTAEENANHQTLLNKNNASGMENCIKRAQEGDFPTLEEIKVGMMTPFDNTEEREIPHITDLVMLLNEDRFPEFDTDEESMEKMKNHFIMQYPKLSQFVVEDLEEMNNSPQTKQIIDESKISSVKKAIKNVVKPPQLDQILKYITDQNGTEDDVKIAQNLIDFIKDKKELGASPKDLKAQFIKQIGVDLAQLLQFLCDINVILRTGVASIVYVHHSYQSEWLTETFMLTAQEKEIFDLKKQDMKDIEKNLKSLMGEKIQSTDPRRVQLKPWTKLDGCINDEVFQEWLCIILSRCIDLPNIPFLVLCEQFHYIKPVDIYFLLEVLQEMGCIEICVFSNARNDFYSPRCVSDECEATCLDSFEEMFLKPTNISGLCFGSFLDKNFLEV